YRFDMGRQANRRKMRDDAVGAGLGKKPSPCRELKGERHAEPDRFAMKQAVGKSRRRLEGMPEGVAEIEQHAVAGLTLLPGDNRSLSAATDGDGVPPSRPAREDVAPVRVKPFEEIGIAQ